MLEILIAFLLGLTFIYFFYKNLWCYAKIKGRELKITAKYGKDSNQLQRFKSKFSTFKCSKIVRLSLLLLFIIPTILIGGKKGLGAFIIAVILGNLTIFWLGIKKSYNRK